MTRFQRAYLGAFFLALVLCWSPVNALGYVAPFAVLIWISAIGNSGTVLFRASMWGCAVLIAIASRALLERGFLAHSGLLWFVTYGAAAFLIAVPSRQIADGRLYERMLRILPYVLVIQGALGITQAVYGAARTGSLDSSNGDFVEGTIHPALWSEQSFSNAIFAANIGFLLLAMIPAVMRWRRDALALSIGLVVFVLASVVHVLLFWAVAAAAAIALYRPPLPRGTLRAAALAVALGLPLLAYRILEKNFALIPVGIELFAETPKATLARLVVTEIPQSAPESRVIGLGPGQFASRASLIGTGMFFGRPDNPTPVPLLPTGMSQLFREHAYPLWMESVSNPFYGSTQQPFSSWLSVYAELGPVVLGALLLSAVVLLMRARRAARSASRRLLAASYGSGIVLLVLLGFQENYWEVPQAILIGCMLLKVQHALLFHAPAAPPAPSAVVETC